MCNRRPLHIPGRCPDKPDRSTGLGGKPTFKAVDRSEEPRFPSQEMSEWAPYFSDANTSNWNHLAYLIPLDERIRALKTPVTVNPESFPTDGLFRTYRILEQAKFLAIDGSWLVLTPLGAQWLARLERL